ncbi:MAG TPA: type II secretion system protein [Thermoanaerobaculia bacterium]
MSRSRRTAGGFTIAELITVCAIIAVLAATTLPVAQFGLRREKEIELHAKLRRITDGIDRYHDIMTIPPTSQIRPAEMAALGSEGYPKELQDLVKGIKLNDGRTIRILRDRDLVDPITGKKDWMTRSTTDDPDTTSSDGNNIFEVHSTSTALTLDGKTRYNEW